MASRVLLASLLLVLFTVSFATEVLGDVSSSGRGLLKDKKKSDKKSKLTAEEKAEQKRVADALAAYEKEQKRREKEKDAALKQARKDAEEEITNFNEAEDEDGQIAVFVKLWKNAEGPTILAALTTLVSSSEEAAGYYLQVVADSMLEADRKGYSFQISNAIAAALTLVEREDDGEPLLDAILLNLETRNKSKKNSGCTYIKNLFTDAEVVAIESGYEIEFTRALDNSDHLPLVECFYGECDGEAAECCADEDVVLTGRCGCSKKEPDQCDFNLFLNVPRPIWRCNGEDCVEAKCMCPEAKKKAKKSKKSNSKGKGRKKVVKKVRKPKKSQKKAKAKKA